MAKQSGPKSGSTSRKRPKAQKTQKTQKPRKRGR